MNKRMRKKNRRGEFQELGFTLDLKFKPGTEAADADAFFDGLIDLADKLVLNVGSDVKGNNLEIFIAAQHYSSNPTNETIQKFVDFCNQDETIESVTAGQLRDVWYGWE